jgi:hypothetical protein
MNIRGACRCNNIEVTWHNRDYSLVPRACQCDYCRERRAAYVSKSGTRIEVRIRRPQYHREIRHGSNSAVFHECGYCNQVMLVTAEFDGVVYGALNARQLNPRFAFPEPVEADYDGQSAERKQNRWRENWCCPVTFIIAGRQ